MLRITTARKIGQTNVSRTHPSLTQGLGQYLGLLMRQHGVTTWRRRYTPPAETSHLGQDRGPTRPCMRRRFDDCCGGPLAQHWAIVTLIERSAGFFTATTRREHLQLHQGFV